MENETLYYYKLEKDGTLTCESADSWTIRMYNGREYLRVEIKDKSYAPYLSDIDKFKYGRMWTFNNDPVFVWDTISKYLFSDMLKKERLYNAALDQYDTFRQNNKDPRRK